jgi:DNA-binding NarL/FixJ family response regulator
MTNQELCVLVAQQDPVVSRRVEQELLKAGIRIAGPVADLERALARPESQVVAVALVDVLLAEGGGAIERFRSRHPSLPLVATAPKRFETRARDATTAGASVYLLHEEIGRGLLAPVLRHVARADPHEVRATSEAESRQLLHDLGNHLAVANGESEMLLSRVAAGDPLRSDIGSIHDAISESVRVFRRLAAGRRIDAGH